MSEEQTIFRKLFSTVKGLTPTWLWHNRVWDRAQSSVNKVQTSIEARERALSEQARKNMSDNLVRLNKTVDDLQVKMGTIVDKLDKALAEGHLTTAVNKAVGKAEDAAKSLTEQAKEAAQNAESAAKGVVDNLAPEVEKVADEAKKEVEAVASKVAEPAENPLLAAVEKAVKKTEE